MRFTILGPRQEALGKRVHVQMIGKMVRKYTLPGERWDFPERFSLPSVAFDVEQIWEQTVEPPVTYVNGVFLSLQVAIVCTGGLVYVTVHDGVEEHRVTLAPGHVLHVPPMVWYRFFSKQQAQVMLIVDKPMHTARFMKMTDREFAALRTGKPL